MISNDFLSSSLNNIIEIIKIKNYKEAGGLATRIIVISESEKNKKVVFIFECLESVLLQWNRDVKQSIIPEDEEQSEIDKITNLISHLRDTIINDDNVDLFVTLIELRYYATQFQFTAPARFKQVGGRYR